MFSMPAGLLAPGGAQQVAEAKSGQEPKCPYKCTGTTRSSVAWAAARAPSIAGPGSRARPRVAGGSVGTCLELETAAAVTEGAPLWSDVVDSSPGESYDVGHGVAVGAEGRVHVVGHVDPDIYHRTYRKYASKGELLCSLTLPAPDPTSPTLFDVALDGDGFPLIVGYEGSELFVARLTP